MEGKVVVLTPNGRRQTIRINANTTMLHILEEACSKHGFSSDEYCLKHHNKEVTLSQTFRFSGLPNNCLLEMSPTERKRVAANVDICVQLEDGTRYQDQFKPNDSLWNVLGKLCGDKLQTYTHPVAIYTRQEVVGKEQLTGITLKSLGIIEGRALIHLLNKKPEELKTQANFYVAPVVNNAANTDNTERNKVSSALNTTRSDASNSDVGRTSAFEISKNLIKTLKKESAEEPPIDKHEVKAEKQLKENTATVESKQQQPTYDWNTGVGRSMQSSQNKSRANANEEIAQKEPQYHIVGERNAVIYSLDNVHTKIDDLPDSFYDLTVSDLKLILRDLKNTAAGNDDAPLLTENLREHRANQTMLNKIAQYKNCVIRIKFPDGYVLQAMFKPIETIADVLEFIKTFLIKPKSKCYLFTIPPKHKLPLTKTLLELDLVPNSLVQFSYEDEADNHGNLIKAEYLQDLTPIEGALFVADKFRQTLRGNKSPTRDANSTDSSRAQQSTGAIPKRPRNDS